MRKIIVIGSLVFITGLSAQGFNSQENSATDLYNTYSFDDSTQVDTSNAKYIKRNYNHQEQVIVGSMIMSFFAILLVAMNNYNPKR
ncbi:MAG: hypothetical protein OCC49_16880 [Fibrobacterales bacterium]